MFGYYDYVCTGEKHIFKNSHGISRISDDLTSDILPDSVRRNFSLSNFKKLKIKNKRVS